MDVPALSDSTKSASRKTAKWAESVGLAQSKCSAIFPAVIGRSLNNCRIRRRVGSDRALKTRFIVRSLANDRNTSISIGHAEPLANSRSETPGTCVVPQSLDDYWVRPLSF